jgi:hypothetical protein
MMLFKVKKKCCKIKSKQEISLIESIKILLKSDNNNVLFVVPHYVTNIVEIMCILFLSVILTLAFQKIAEYL